MDLRGRLSELANDTNATIQNVDRVTLNNPYETYAVLLESTEESKEELGNIEYLLADFWLNTKKRIATQEKQNKRIDDLRQMYWRSLDLAEEMIHIAITAQKAILQEQEKGEESWRNDSKLKKH